MMKRLLFTLVVVAGCTKAGPGQETPPSEPTVKDPGAAPIATPPPAQVLAKVELTAVTLADDCGGSPPWNDPTAAKEAAPPAGGNMKSSQSASFARAKRRCEQTSMQVSITAADATDIKVKSVELFDETGKSLGTLAASKPTQWSTTSSAYEAWDEKLAAGSTLNASYVLEQPKWDTIGDRWNRTFTVKTVFVVGGAETAAQKEVTTISAPVALPPNVKT